MRAADVPAVGRRASAGLWNGPRDAYGEPVTIPRHSLGFVYILTNDIMPGLVKIGLTTALPEDRAKELFNTGVPNPFNVAFRAITSWPKAVERRTHQLLKRHRVNPKREFFRVSVDEAIA